MRWKGGRKETERQGWVGAGVERERKEGPQGQKEKRMEAEGDAGRAAS